VAKKEAFSASAFSDFGQTNIGYGTSARGRTSITEAEARTEMRAELEKHAAEINKLNPNLPPGAKDALASLSFNTGGSWYKGPDKNADGSLTLKGLVKAGDIAGAQQRFLQYTKAGGKTLGGLVTRRQQEAQMFTDPRYVSSGQGTTATQDWGGPGPAQAAPPMRIIESRMLGEKPPEKSQPQVDEAVSGKELDKDRQVKVNGTGKITVDVKTDPTRGSESETVLKKVSIERSIQMQKAEAGKEVNAEE
jgi:lysozyme